MKKLIDIPDEILEDLQILAVKDKKPLKNYIENLLVIKTKGQKDLLNICPDCGMEMKLLNLCGNTRCINYG